MTDITTNRQALDTLKQMSLDLANVEYETILDIMRKSITRIPIPIAKLHAHSKIDRIRKNIGNALFSDVHNELSYIKDPAVIANYLTEFGRANKPHQPLFYGSVNSSRVGTPRITALAETSALFQDKNGINIEGELYTVSRWENIQDLFLAEIVFSNQAIEANPDIRTAFNNQQKLAAEGGFPDMDFYTDFLIFISDQFARPKATHHDYKISTAYSELVLQHPDIHGIAYPSVQTGYWGQNVVFPPAVVDQYLRPTTLAVQRLHKNMDTMHLNNFKNCENPQDCLTKVTWKDIAPEHIASEEYIKAYLTGKIS